MITYFYKSTTSRLSLARLQSILLFAVLLLASCSKDISLDLHEQQSRLQVYAFPSLQDTFLINVSLTHPIFGPVGELRITDITCTTNGVPDKVQLLHQEEHYGLPMAIYQAVGHHRPGDEICIRVSDASAPSVTATTAIPLDVPPTAVVCDSAYVPGLNIHYGLTLTDPSDADNYYAVRVLHRNLWVHDSHYWPSNTDPSDDLYFVPSDFYYGPYNPNHDEPQFAYTQCDIDLALEHKLNHYTDTNFDPWNEYYRSIYFFSDRDFTSPTDQFHLYVPSKHYGDAYLLQYLILSPDYYKMLRRINDQLSNELAESGLTITSTTYNNVQGGYGCVAGYICHEYLKLLK